MKLSDCLKEGQPELALIVKEDWMENKCLLRYGKKLEIVTAWNLKEDFIPTVDDLFADDWEISTSYDKWLRTEKRNKKEAINKHHDKPIKYGVNIISKCEYIGSMESHSIKEAYEDALEMWRNGIIFPDESSCFQIDTNLIQEITVFDENDQQYVFNCEGMDNDD